MTHPAFYTITDAIEALDEALKSADLNLPQQQVLTDLRDDLHQLEDFDTFADAVAFAKRHAALGHH